jgi:RHS repeat-associated protein
MPFEGLTRDERDLLQSSLQKALTQPINKLIQPGVLPGDVLELLSNSVATLKAAHDASAKAHPVTIRHYLTDHLGTPIALVDANGENAGQVTWAANYSAWGDLKEEYNPLNLYQPIRLQGQQIDIETGLHYNRYRYYDSTIGQYLTQDPIGLMGGANAFIYPTNPLSLIDPLGLIPGDKTFGINDPGFWKWWETEKYGWGPFDSSQKGFNPAKPFDLPNAETAKIMKEEYDRCKARDSGRGGKSRSDKKPNINKIMRNTRGGGRGNE